MNNMINNAFIHENGATQTPTSKLAEINATPQIILWMVTTNILLMTVLVDNISVRFGGQLFRRDSWNFYEKKPVLSY